MDWCKDHLNFIKYDLRWRFVVSCMYFGPIRPLGGLAIVGCGMAVVTAGLYWITMQSLAGVPSAFAFCAFVGSDFFLYGFFQFATLW